MSLNALNLFYLIECSDGHQLQNLNIGVHLDLILGLKTIYFKNAALNFLRQNFSTLYKANLIMSKLAHKNSYFDFL